MAALELISKADAAFRGGDNLLAVALYAEALDATSADDVSRATLYANRSFASLRCGDVAGAVRDAVSALATDATYVKAYYRAGASLQAAGWSDLSLQSFELGVQRAPGNKELVNGLEQARLLRSLAVRSPGFSRSSLLPARSRRARWHRAPWRARRVRNSRA